jgi:hypothetical protein
MGRPEFRKHKELAGHHSEIKNAGIIRVRIPPQPSV